MKKMIALLLLFVLASTVYADVAIEGQVFRRVRVSNLDDFSDYDFYIMYQGYHYDQGYQQDPLEEVRIFSDSLFLAGERGATSAIFARRKSDGEVFQSEISVGGDKIVQQRNALFIEDIYKITGIKDGKVDLKMTESTMHLPGGKTKTLKKSGITGMSLFGVDIAYIALPLICLAALLFFFMRRRKPTA